MGQSSYTDLDVSEILRETDSAFLVLLEDGEEAWIPKSQVADAADYAVGDKDLTLSITEWLARQNGWMQ